MTTTTGRAFCCFICGDREPDNTLAELELPAEWTAAQRELAESRPLCDTCWADLDDRQAEMPADGYAELLAGLLAM